MKEKAGFGELLAPPAQTHLASGRAKGCFSIATLAILTRLFIYTQLDVL